LLEIIFRVETNAGEKPVLRIRKSVLLFPPAESGKNIPDHIYESLEIIFFGLKIPKFFDGDPDLGSF